MLNLLLQLTGFIVYTILVVALVVVLILLVPRYGTSHLVVYIGICSLMGSLTVCSLFSSVEVGIICVFLFYFLYNSLFHS